MGILVKIVVALAAIGVAYVWYSITTVPPIPKLERTWWGAGEPTKQDESIRPFKISISDEILEDLNERLEFHGPLTPPLETKGFEYGFNTNYLKTVVDFWRNEYKWREREAFLNSVPHFKTRISGLDLHFIHVKPKAPAGTRVVPMLMLHGWPGSVREFYGVIPLLSTPRQGSDVVFELIIPSLPGYGFSDGAAKPGLGAAQMAVVMNNLMERIGHKQYYLHGGDWGAIITTHMAQLFPENAIALHTSMCFISTALSNIKTFIGSFWPSLVVPQEEAHLMYPYSQKLMYILEESGYMHIQATKPDTVGVALSDSPVGLAAYILEKFSTWTNKEWKKLPDGGLTNKYTLTDLLDNIMIYWVTGSITTSVRLYSETFNTAQYELQLDYIPVTVPSACAQFPGELMHQSQFVLQEKYQNLVRYTNMLRGGHFAAFEEPGLMADDIWAFSNTIEVQRKDSKKQ